MALNQSRLKYDRRTLIATFPNSAATTTRRNVQATHLCCSRTSPKGHILTVVMSRVVKKGYVNRQICFSDVRSRFIRAISSTVRILGAAPKAESLPYQLSSDHGEGPSPITDLHGAN